MDILPSRLKPVQRRQIDRKKPPPVAKKPSEEIKQRKLAEKRSKADKDKKSQFALPPPIGYNDADRYYISDPIPIDQGSIGSNDSLNDHILNETNDKRTPNPNKSSKWLDKQLDHGNRRKGKHSEMARNAQTDTQEFERDNAKQKRILHEKISDLETENKIKDRELDTNKWIEKEMDRKLKTTEDLFALKQHLKDKERLIEQLERSNRDLIEETSRLEEEIAEKERCIFELQAEVDNLDRVIVAKNALREGDKIRELGDELDRTKDDYSAAEHETDRLKKEINNTHYQLERREREIAIKNEKIDQLNNELTDLSKEIGNLENDKMALDNHLKTSDRENRMLRDQEARHSELKQKFQALKDENDYLKDSIRALEAKIRHLEGVHKEKNALEDAVVELTNAVQDKNKIYKDRNRLEEENQMLKESLRDKTADEAGALKELDQVKAYAAELDKENEFYRELEKDFHAVKFKYEELERSRYKNEKIIAQLRPKIQRLQNRCREKDDLIRRLANELRSTGDYLPKGLLIEADRNQAKALDDYINPADLSLIDDNVHSPNVLSSQVSPLRQPRSRNLIKELRPDLLDNKYLPAWNEPLYVRPPSDAITTPRHQRTSLSPQARRKPYQTTQRTDSESRIPTSLANRRSYSPPQRQRVPQRKYGTDETPIVSDTLPEVAKSQYPTENAPHSSPGTQKTPPVKEFQPEFNHPPLQKDSTFPLPHKKPEEPLSSGQLAPPSNIRIARTLSDGSVMIEWSPPAMDSLDRNNGIVVAGYKIFVNNVEDQQISSSRLTKALLSSDIVTPSAKISVQTFGYDGEISDKVDVGDSAQPQKTSGPSQRNYHHQPQEENPVRLHTHPDNAPNDSYKNYPSDNIPYNKNPDVIKPQTATANYTAPDNYAPVNRRNSFPIPMYPEHITPRQSQPNSREISPRRAGSVRPSEVGESFVAKCDYDPSNQSPSAFPSYELSFKQGDHVDVFGPVRPDGLYNAQINGRRGVVPAQYLDIH